MKKKRLAVTILLLTSILMLVVAVIPHHHHPNSDICLKQDLTEEAQCPTHQHAPEHHSCCKNECLTRFHSLSLSVHTGNKPDYVFVATLFTDYIIGRLLHPIKKKTNYYDFYRTSLHGTNIVRTFSLRAPPCIFLA